MDERKNVHTLQLEQRQKLNLCGILDVLSFDEDEILLDTELGSLTISGSALHINRLNVDNGEMVIEGEINACVYSDRNQPRGGLFSRMFR